MKNSVQMIFLSAAIILGGVSLIDYMNSSDQKINNDKIQFCQGNYLASYDMYMDVYGIYDEEWRDVYEEN